MHTAKISHTKHRRIGIRTLDSTDLLVLLGQFETGCLQLSVGDVLQDFTRWDTLDAPKLTASGGNRLFQNRTTEGLQLVMSNNVSSTATSKYIVKDSPIMPAPSIICQMESKILMLAIRNAHI